MPSSADTVRHTISKLTVGDDVPNKDLLDAAAHIIEEKQQEIFKLRARLDPTYTPTPATDGWTEQISAIRDLHPEHAEVLDQVIQYINVDVANSSLGAILRPGGRPTVASTDPIVSGLRSIESTDQDTVAYARNAANAIELLLVEVEQNRRLEAARQEKILTEVRESRQAYQLWLAEHDERPDTYLGRPQPGASPSYYGPDDVVVDGDWLEAHERRAKQQTKKLDRIQLALNDHGRTAEQKLAAITASFD